MRELAEEIVEAVFRTVETNDMRCLVKNDAVAAVEIVLLEAERVKEAAVRERAAAEARELLGVAKANEQEATIRWPGGRVDTQTIPPDATSVEVHPTSSCVVEWKSW